MMLDDYNYKNFNEKILIPINDEEDEISTINREENKRNNQESDLQSKSEENKDKSISNVGFTKKEIEEIIIA